MSNLTCDFNFSFSFWKNCYPLIIQSMLIVMASASKSKEKQSSIVSVLNFKEKKIETAKQKWNLVFELLQSTISMLLFLLTKYWRCMRFDISDISKMNIFDELLLIELSTKVNEENKGYDVVKNIKEIKWYHRRAVERFLMRC